MKEKVCFKKVNELAYKRRICTIKPQPVEFKDIEISDRVKLHGREPGNYRRFVMDFSKLEEWFYWVGRYVGDGWLSIKRGSLQMCFGRHEEADARRFVDFIEENNLVARLKYMENEIGGKSIVVIVSSKDLVRYLTEILGIISATARTKRVPKLVWTAPLKYREQFLQGYIDSDGCKSQETIHTMNGELLREIQLIFDITRTKRTTLSGGDSRKCGSWTLNYHIKKDNGCKRLHKDYGFANFRRLEISSIYATTYTLAVKDDKHQFVSEGVISKNSAGDLMKLALIKIHNDLRERRRRDDLWKRVTVISTVHDEVILRAPEKVAEEYGEVVRNMMVGLIKLRVPIEASLGIADRWGEAK